MTYFAGVDESGFVQVQTSYEPALPQDGMGPPSPIPDGPYVYHEVQERVTASSKPTPTARLMWVDDTMVWVEHAVLADLQAAAYAKCFDDINAVVWDAVGNLTEEYKDSLVEALAYVAAGYVDDAPPMVACYADKEGQSGPWAADDIIARAHAFQSAKVAMRVHRMARQKEMSAATTLAELDTAVATWDSFIALLRAQLGL